MHELLTLHKQRISTVDTVRLRIPQFKHACARGKHFTLRLIATQCY